MSERNPVPVTAENLLWPLRTCETFSPGKVHATTDGRLTLCKRYIVHHDESGDEVTCKRCVAAHARLEREAAVQREEGGL